MSIDDFVYDSLGGRVVFGVGSRRELGTEVDRLGASRVLLVAGSHEDEIAADLGTVLGDRQVGRFADVVQHVPGPQADAAIALARSLDADAVVTVGGGSATGFGKIIALALSLPTVAVPTTYAGSEMTAIWGRTDGDHKQTGTDPRVKPATVIYDAELTLSLPAHIAAPSGMNAQL